jgi:MFS family permease
MSRVLDQGPVSDGSVRSAGSWRPFVVLEASTLLSGVGNGIALIALPWIVLTLTGRASDAGLVAAVSGLPLLVTALFAGTVVDRFGRRRTSVLSDLLSAASVAAIPLVAANGELTVGWLMALGALGAVFDPAGATAREAMLPAAAQRAGLPLERANGIHEAVFGVSFLVAPGIGGLLIATVGAESTLWATTVAFVAASLLIGLVAMPGASRPERHEDRASFLSDTAAGMRFVWHTPSLRSLALVYLALVALWMPIEGVILPYVYQAQGAATSLGLLLTAMSAGVVVGSLMYGWLGGRVPRRPAFLIALTGTALPLIGMAFLPPLPWLLALGFTSGLLFGPINPIVNVVMQERSPELMRGRVVGVFMAAAYAAGPLGLVLVGPVIHAVGASTAFLALAIAMTVLTLGAVGLRGLHELGGAAPPD